MAGLSLAPSLAAMGWRGYVFLRQAVAGLDYITLSMALFAVAVLISLGKSGFLTQWLEALQKRGTSLAWLGSGNLTGIQTGPSALPSLDAVDAPATEDKVLRALPRETHPE